MLHYKVITISHHTTQINRLKDYLLSDVEKSDYPLKSLTNLKKSLDIKELMYLNTCNRVTFFFTTGKHINHEFLSSFFKNISPDLQSQTIEKHIDVSQIYEGEQAISYLFRVASSMDSLIVGEREILGQIKEAYQKAKDNGLCGDSVRLAVEQAVVFAKKVYNETRIGEKPVSVVSLAFREMLKHNSDSNAKILKIGAGQTNGLLSNLLIKYGFTNVSVYNRTLDNAVALADKFKGKAYPLEQLENHSEDFDIVVSCTGSQDLVLTKEIFDKIAKDKTKKYVLVDLAVPRDIDPRIVESYPVQYIDVASLKQEAENNLNFRKGELEKAYQLLGSFVEEFKALFKQRKLELALSEIPNQVKALKDKAFSEVFAKELDTLDSNTKEILEKVVSYMEEKYISLPYKTAKKTLLEVNIKE